MKTELSYILAIDEKGRLILNMYDLQLSFVAVVIGLSDEEVFYTINLDKQI